MMSTRRERLVEDVIDRAVDAVQDGFVDKADDILRRAVHAGLRPVEIVTAALARQRITVKAGDFDQEATMRIVYEGPEPGVRLAPALGDLWCPRGEPVEVPDDVGRSLCDQSGFRRARRRTETPTDPRAGTETPENPDPTVETR